MLFSISTLFIKRPVLTTVCTIVIILVGAISIPLLPIAKLPQIAPTQVQVTATNIGSDARTTEETVTTIIEREINGVEDMKYMSSNTSNNGVTNITVTFPTEVDRNTAQVNVQNRVAQAEAELPEVVRQTGVTINKASPNILMAMAFYSEKNENGEYIYDTSFISNYVDLYVLDEIRRIKGVGRAQLVGERKYAMRIWLDPDKLAARGLNARDVVSAVQEQNIQVGAGKIGQQPAPDEQQYEIPLRAVGRIKNVEEAENLVIQVGDNGTLIRLKDVGRAELGAESYDTDVIWNGLPAIGLPVYQLPGSNALDTANAIKAKLAELSKQFPPGMKGEVGFDPTLFVTSSIQEVVLALVQAIALVVAIIFVFLQDWRTTLIPAIAIPVALIGAMAFLLMFGFELNQLTLFGCVLATGLVVDDGIVVVEAIAKKIEHGMRPMQAALDSMEELFGAVIATSIVLMAVFIPVSFFPGSTGIVYRQFALTIAFAIALSTFNAITFSPSMSAVLLRPRQEAQGPLGAFFRLFNRFFEWVNRQYRRFIEFLTRIKMLVVGIFVAGLVITIGIYQIVPSGFVPEEDQGYFIIIGQAPAGVSLNYTAAQAEQIDKLMSDIKGIRGRFCLVGFGFDGNGSDKLICFAPLKPWDERPGAENSVYGLLAQANQKLGSLTGMLAFAVNAPPVDGLGQSGGFEFQLQNRQLLPMEALIDNAQKLVAAANQRPEFKSPSPRPLVFTTFTSNTPQMEISIDRAQAKALNVDIDEIFETLRTYLGSNYVNDFVLGQRQYRVYVQADREFRSNPDDISRLYVRSRDGNMVQLSNVVNINDFIYPPTVAHYNIYPSIKIQGAPAPGYSTGQAIAAMEEIAAQVLQPGFGFEWTGTALEEKSSGGAAPIIFGLGFVMVFLVLAAQYESYIDPAIIMLTVPLAVLGALGGIWFRANIFQAGGLWPVVNNNIYCQVGLVMLIGMASKNAILIVEFANQSRELGMSITQAALYAAEQRFRPILMTAISTLVGFMPLVTAKGAGSLARWSLGTAVFGGMLVATFLSLLFAPILYIVIKNLEEAFLKGGGSGKPRPSRRTVESMLPPSSEEETVPTFRASGQNE
ncbi:hydrophobe/amphiphile efflux-1 (HAE1) family transporter [Pleurocapsa sp. PCC 7327]|uniref:efflux RND transporter permease subunit n=1 Tax=Pleurocapsa sp. PCC 7327 TaxID=118163 RepID=UPI00029FF567|nr:efflux RND transporter permease subunit [Pleurocapsa sp. PCC 7327]AFY77532.1 hydrophobe/amphiphile efflux-1 (HAE1) family transporter [Pleurocapsa sp. PCC 7327]